MGSAFEVPEEVLRLPQGIKSVSAGLHSSAAISMDGQLWMWGKVISKVRHNTCFPTDLDFSPLTCITLRFANKVSCILSQTVGMVRFLSFYRASEAASGHMVFTYCDCCHRAKQVVQACCCTHNPCFVWCLDTTVCSLLHLSTTLL